MLLNLTMPVGRWITVVVYKILMERKDYILHEKELLL